jgi:hypothetical protein
MTTEFETTLRRFLNDPFTNTRIPTGPNVPLPGDTFIPTTGTFADSQSGEVIDVND